MGVCVDMRDITVLYNQLDYCKSMCVCVFVRKQWKWQRFGFDRVCVDYLKKMKEIECYFVFFWFFVKIQ